MEKLLSFKIFIAFYFQDNPSLRKRNQLPGSLVHKAQWSQMYMKLQFSSLAVCSSIFWENSAIAHLRSTCIQSFVTWSCSSREQFKQTIENLWCCLYSFIPMIWSDFFYHSRTLSWLFPKLFLSKLLLLIQQMHFGF